MARVVLHIVDETALFSARDALIDAGHLVNPNRTRGGVMRALRDGPECHYDILVSEDRSLLDEIAGEGRYLDLSLVHQQKDAAVLVREGRLLAPSAESMRRVAKSAVHGALAKQRERGL